MNSEIKRDGEREFLVFRVEKEGKWDLFGKEMGIHNEFPSMLPFQVRFFNGEEQLFYDVTGKISLKDYFLKEKIQKKDLIMIFSAMEKAFSGMREFLLEEKNILILPEYMYIDTLNQQLFLCYYPIYHEFYEENIAYFSEFILEQLDYEDEAATTMAYQFYRGAKQEGLLLQQVLIRIFQKEPENIAQNGTEEKEKPLEEDFATDYYKQPYVQEEPITEKKQISIWFVKSFLIGFCLNIGSVLGLIIHLGVNLCGTVISTEAIFVSFVTYICGLCFIIGSGIMIYQMKNRLSIPKITT